MCVCVCAGACLGEAGWCLCSRQPRVPQLRPRNARPHTALLHLSPAAQQTLRVLPRVDCATHAVQDEEDEYGEPLDRREQRRADRAEAREAEAAGACAHACVCGRVCVCMLTSLL